MAARAGPRHWPSTRGSNESTWGETVILRWNDGIVAVGVPTDNPLGAMRKLRRDDDERDVFRRVRDDGELGEAYVFHREGGAIDRLSVHGNYSRKVR